MTKIVLTEELKQQALQQYHPQIDIELWSLEQDTYDNGDITKDIILQDTVNLKIINEDIEQLLSSNAKHLQEYQKYISKGGVGDFTNIIFTPNDDINTIIPYEYYKGVFYLELPRFYRVISLHILTSYFDASDNVALFTTEDIIDKINHDITETAWIQTNDNISRSNDKIDVIANANGIGRYLVELPDDIKHFSTLEIDVFYKYNTANNENQIGIIDTNDRGYSLAEAEKKYHEQQTLINANHDYNDSSKQVITATRQQENIKEDSAFSYSNSSDSLFKINTNQHQTNLVYEAIIKYINDDIYIEEYNQRTNDTVDRVSELQTNSHYNYVFTEWIDE